MKGASPALDAQQRAYAAAANVCDPEIPVLTLEDLGIVHTVHAEGEAARVVLLPTYLGCPAMDVLARDVRDALLQAGFKRADVQLSYSPPWSTRLMSPAAHEKLRAAGIAPPRDAEPPRCPHCDSSQVECLSAFGSTACKALWRCQSCLEPFDLFKCVR